MSIGTVDKVSAICNIKNMNKIDERQHEDSARLLRVLGHPMRLAIIESLNEKTWCVCELAVHLGLNKSAASKHLSLLKSVGVINMERDGTQVNCTLVMPCILDLIHCANRGTTPGWKPVHKEKQDGSTTISACCNKNYSTPGKERQ